MNNFPHSYPPLLAVNRATKFYGAAPALFEAELSLMPGEVHALLGENGAGKSTLIKILAGVVKPDTAEIIVRGEQVRIPDAHTAFNLGLRFIHQELSVVPHLSVAENIVLSQPYPARAGIFVNWGRLYNEARDVLERLGVIHIAPRTVMARLSPGDQMLVKIAAAFAGDAAWVYVMDEPTAALTGHETEMLFRVIERLREEDRAILYVSHRLDEIFQISQRVTVMRDGRVVMCEATSMLNTDLLIQAMTGRDVSNVYPQREESVQPAERLRIERLTTNKVGNISFSARKGEIIGIAGLSGSGRTELLRALMGLDRIRSGRIMLDGQPFWPRNPTHAWKNGLAYLPEERRSQGLILNQSVVRNIFLSHLRAYSWGGIWLNQRRQRLLSRKQSEVVALKARGTDQIVWQLSGGNQQKVVLARTLLRTPRLLLLDEPTRGVDVSARQDIYALIRRVSSEGTTVLLVSSELQELLGLCDRVVVLRNGEQQAMMMAVGLTEERLLSICYGETIHDNDEQIEL